MALADEVRFGLIVLYRDVLGPPELDVTQLGTPGEVSAYQNAEAATSLNQLTDALQLDDSREERYCGALAYVLGIRYTLIDPPLPDIDAQLSDLGVALLGYLGAPASGEPALRGALASLIETPVIDSTILNGLQDAFGNSLLKWIPSGTEAFSLSGDATEMAAMLLDLATMGLGCDSEVGYVTVNGERLKVLRIRYEICSPLPFSFSVKGIDPRNWPDTSPMFKSVQVIAGNAPTAGSWHGTIQEVVRAPGTQGIKTNLLVSYLEQPHLAVTTYDLSNDPTLLADDGSVVVDYGYFSLVDEGSHRRLTMLKVVSITGKEDMPPFFLCPLDAQQFGMIGWWFPNVI